MEQIAVVKITSEGRRNMMIPSDMWDKIVSGEGRQGGVTWELRKVDKPVIKETKIIQEEIREVELIAEPKKPEPVKEIPKTEAKRVYKTRR